MDKLPGKPMVMTYMGVPILKDGTADCPKCGSKLCWTEPEWESNVLLYCQQHGCAFEV